MSAAAAHDSAQDHPQPAVSTPLRSDLSLDPARADGADHGGPPSLTLVEPLDYDQHSPRKKGTVVTVNGSSDGAAKVHGSTRDQVIDLTDTARLNGHHGHAVDSTLSWLNPDPPAVPALKIGKRTKRVINGDARDLAGLPDDSVDLIVTSPPYWQKRDYGVDGQIGQEDTPAQYVEAIRECFSEWRRVLRPTGSVFFNVGDTYHKRSLAGVPGRIEAALHDDDWMIRNRIIWTKDKGMPEAVNNRLTTRHEYILHLTLDGDYFYDLHSYSTRFGNGTNPGDVWHMSQERNMGRHLAPFPADLVRRAIVLGCPRGFCPQCGEPKRPVVERSTMPALERVQARRAVELAIEHGLTEAHIRAIQATGVSDAGKALKTQNGTGRNSVRVKELAAEAKEALGGYFREFTFTTRVQTGWSGCDHEVPLKPGVVLDPFMGTGTTLTVAAEEKRSAIGVDLSPHWADQS